MITVFPTRDVWWVAGEYVIGYDDLRLWVAGSVPVSLVGEAQATASTLGLLTQVHTLRAESPTSTETIASLAQVHVLAGSARATAATDAPLTQVHRLIATLTVVASAEGLASTTAITGLTGIAQTTSSSVAAITQTHCLAARSSATATTLAALTQLHRLVGGTAISTSARAVLGITFSGRLRGRANSIAEFWAGVYNEPHITTGSASLSHSPVWASSLTVEHSGGTLTLEES